MDDPEIHPSVRRWSHGIGQPLDPYGQSVHHHIAFLFPVSAAVGHTPKFTAPMSAFVSGSDFGGTQVKTMGFRSF